MRESILSWDQNHNSVLVVLDYSTKKLHFLSCYKMLTKFSLTTQFICGVLYLHNSPNLIVTDRSFICFFWFRSTVCQVSNWKQIKRYLLLLILKQIEKQNTQIMIYKITWIVISTISTTIEIYFFIWQSLFVITPAIWPQKSIFSFSIINFTYGSISWVSLNAKMLPLMVKIKFKSIIHYLIIPMKYQLIPEIIRTYIIMRIL